MTHVAKYGGSYTQGYESFSDDAKKYTDYIGFTYTSEFIDKFIYAICIYLIRLDNDAELSRILPFFSGKQNYGLCIEMAEYGCVTMLEKYLDRLCPVTTKPNYPESLTGIASQCHTLYFYAERKNQQEVMSWLINHAIGKHGATPRQVNMIK
jgi:hypothetical protein